MPSIVWVTGAAGFLGRHLTQRLLRSGYRVARFVRPDTERSAGTSFGVYNLTEPGLSTALSVLGMPKLVYHLAGGSTIGASMTDPDTDFLDNVVTTHTVLNFLRQLNQSVPFVLASSAAVYGEGHDGAISVTDTAQPSSPYGYHKRMAENLCNLYADSFGLPVTICRLFSIYGPELRKQLLYELCGKMADNSCSDPIVLGGTGDERRDWLYIDDAIEALATLPRIEPGQVACFNLASGRSTSIRDLSHTFVQTWGAEREITFSGLSRAGDPSSLVADPASLPPNFIPRTKILDGLAALIGWYKTEEIQANVL